MARPREFEEEEVLDKALATFYARGFDGTSISDLVEATGLNRASLYGAFGDKEALFRRTLEHYRARAGRIAEKMLAMPSAQAALHFFFDSMIESACPQRGPRGCYMLLSASANTEDHPVAAALYRELTAEIEKRLTKVVERGQSSGELRPDLEPKTTAKLLMVTSQGLSVGARTGRSKSELKQVAAQAVEALVAR
jgi:TetR/AcrR family transcriptional repressor of nem operon